MKLAIYSIPYSLKNILCHIYLFYARSTLGREYISNLAKSGKAGV